MTSESSSMEKSLLARIKRFVERPWQGKVERVRKRWLEAFPRIPFPMRLSFGAWWLARNDHVSRPIIEKQFETAEYSFVRRFVQPGMTVLDIGAHHGFYTLLLSRVTGSRGMVFSFEPSPRERKALLRHVSLNRCKNVKVQPLALGAEKKEAELYVVEGGETGCNSLRPPVVISGTSRVRVSVMRLDDWISEQKLERVHFIKLDVEGGELEVLRGAVSLLDHRPRPIILAEVQDMRTEQWGYRARDVISYLSAKGFRWFRLSEDGSLEDLDLAPETFDGNFVAWPEELEMTFPGVGV
jgi:FkbM family methyltransferase